MNKKMFWALIASLSAPAMASLSVTMNAPGNADLRQPIDYSLSVTNTSGGATTLTDTLPVGMSYVGATGLAAGACTPATVGAQTTVTCALGTLAAGTPQDLVLTTRVDAIVGGVNPVSNMATASSGSNSATSNPTFVQINTQAHLNVQMVGPSAQVAVGDEITYQMLVVNTSNWVPATNVVVYDTLPTGVFNVQYPSNCSAWTPPGGGSGVQCALGPVAPNVNTAVAITMNAPTTPNTITNTALVQGDNAPGVQTTFPTTVAALTDLGITETGPLTIQQGAPIVYTIAVVNYSAYVPANNVLVTVDLPFTPTSTSPGCVVTGTQVVCSIGTLGVSQNTTLTMSGTPSVLGVVHSTSTVTTSTPESNHHLLQSFWSTVVGNAPVAILQIAKWAPATTALGQGFRFVILVSNVGIATAVQPVITDQLPATFVFGIDYNDCGSFSDTPSLNNVSCSYDAHGQAPGSGHDVVTWQLPDIAPGQSVEMFVGGVPQVLSSDPMSNTAVVTSASDPTSPHSASAQTLIVPPPPLFLGKGAPTNAFIHSTFTYTVGMSNTTASTLHDVMYVDTLPVGVSFVSLGAVPWLPAWTCQVTHDAATTRDTVSCAAPPIPPGSGNSNVANLEITVRANQLGVLTNTATATSPDFGTLQSPSVNTNIIGGADYEVKAVAPPSSTLIKTDVAFPVRVTNHGPDDAGYTSIQFYTPNGWVVTGVTSDVSQGYHSCTLSVPPSCDWGSQASGATVTATLYAHAPAVADPAGNPSTFSANVSAWQVDPNLGNNTDTWSTQVLAGANVSINQTSLIRAAVGLPASYTILVTNQGPDDAQNAVVTDTLFATGGPGAFDTVSATFASGTCTTVSDPTTSSTTVHCPLGTLSAAAGQNAVSINVTFTPRRVGTILSSASIVTDTLNASNSAYNTADISAELATNLSVNIAAATQVALNGTLQYTILVSNTGINPAENVQAALALDPNLPAPLTIPATCSFNSATHLVSCPLGTVVPNAAPTALTVTVSPNTIGNVISTASVTTDTLNQSLQTSQSALTSVITGADLSIQMNGPLTQPVSAPVVYQLLVSNTQNSNISPNTVLIDTIPVHATLISATSDIGPCSSTVVSGATVVQCALGTLSTNASVHATITVQPTLAALNSTLLNSASVSGDVPDPTLANNQSQWSTAIVADPPPTITSLTAAPNPVTTGTTTSLAVVAVDGGYAESQLIYQWTVSGGPVGSSTTFNDPGPSNGAKQTVAHFTSAGTYHFTVSVTNPGAGVVTGSTDVVVLQGFGTGVGSIAVTPSSATLTPGTTELFMATAFDQFGHALVTQPTWTWATPQGGGTVSPSGLFTAGGVKGDYPVQVSAQGLSASAIVTIPTSLIDHIVVTPDGKTIVAPNQLQFTAIAYDINGQEIPDVVFQWTLSGSDSQISSIGLFRAGVGIPGSRIYTVTATAGSAVKSARVTVISPSASVSSDICGGYAYPVPFKETSGLPGVTFTGLAAATHIRVYTIDGRLVQTLQSDNGEDVLWNIRNSSGDKVASGVYVYLIDHNGGPCSKVSEKLVIIK